MPVVVAVAASVQLLQTIAFLLQAVLAYRHGANAQQAAEAEVAKQGHSAGMLAQNGVRFSESPAELLLPIAIAAGLGTLAVLNLAGVQGGRISTWILQPIFLVVAGYVTANQVFATRFLRSAFAKSGDPALQSVDVPAFVDAAIRVFPAWFRSLVVTRFALATIGSLLVVVLLALPAASPHFR